MMRSASTDERMTKKVTAEGIPTPREGNNGRDKNIRFSNERV